MNADSPAAAASIEGPVDAAGDADEQQHKAEEVWGLRHVHLVTAHSYSFLRARLPELPEKTMLKSSQKQPASATATSILLKPMANHHCREWHHSLVPRT